MTINPISSQTLPSVSATSNDPFGADGAAFMQLLLAQMRNQNPLEPVQDKEFMSQLTQLNSLQQLEQMNQSLQALLLTQSTPQPDMAEAAGLIGKNVEGKDANGNTVSGIVSGVTLQDDAILLTVGSAQVALTSVTRVTGAPSTAAAPASVTKPGELERI